MAEVTSEFLTDSISVLDINADVECSLNNAIVLGDWTHTEWRVPFD
jgi:hypothetical protein